MLTALPGYVMRSCFSDLVLAPRCTALHSLCAVINNTSPHWALESGANMKTSFCDAETHAQSECHNLGHCAGDNQVCGFSFCSKIEMERRSHDRVARFVFFLCIFQFKAPETDFSEAKPKRLKKYKVISKIHTFFPLKASLNQKKIVSKFAVTTICLPTKAAEESKKSQQCSWKSEKSDIFSVSYLYSDLLSKIRKHVLNEF